MGTVSFTDTHDSSSALFAPKSRQARRISEREHLDNLGALMKNPYLRIMAPFKANVSQKMSPHTSHQIRKVFEGELTCVEDMIPNMGNIKPGSRAVTDRGKASVTQKMATTKRT